jgi:teichuronic acid biosynthesis glycosyltransferase TuaC
VRVLVVTNFMPDDGAPQRGRWVRDQIAELRGLGVETESFEFPPGKGEYVPATRRLRRLLRRERFDLVHAHYGLAGWCAQLAGARPLVVSFHGTDVRHWLVGPLSRRLAWRAELVAAVSRALYASENGRPGLPPVPGSAVLPCGPDLRRFQASSRADCRRQLGLAAGGRYSIRKGSTPTPEAREPKVDSDFVVTEERGGDSSSSPASPPPR